MLSSELSGARGQEVMSDKAEESAVGPKSQVKRSGKSITPPPLKKRLSMPLLSVREEGEGSSQPGASAVSSEDDEPKGTATSVWEDVPDQLPIPVKINMEIKLQLKKEIRYFEGKYGKILKLLEGVQGPPEVHKKFAVYAMKEAAKFKREGLISHLEKVLEKIERDQFLNKGDGSPSF
ncbi:cancer/testis antigen family 45 member A8-like isoform X1 [Mustela putorius furo]|uniref:Cancer/testis antigen family 45 member A8-like isoform X1 n=2 Tax=Mustela putorius furo TaxID=9669 RepID=A0A8U0RJ04_MUSPF|nr:cancer/testis antigen family 45 member A8-like isoform X1 [Mustela putorius furo]